MFRITLLRVNAEWPVFKDVSGLAFQGFDFRSFIAQADRHAQRRCCHRGRANGPTLSTSANGYHQGAYAAALNHRTFIPQAS